MRNIQAAKWWCWTLLALLLLPGCTKSSVSDDNPPVGKNIILFIGDGLQLEHERATSLYLHGTDRDLSFHTFPEQGYVATWDVTTYDRYAWDLAKARFSDTTFEPYIGYDPARGGAAPFPDSREGQDGYFLTRIDMWHGGAPSRPATDSSSAATAIATGVKTETGNIAWLPGRGALITIMERARAQRGMAIGVVSTVPFSHATPASFVSHNPSRSNYQAISREIIHTIKPEVVIGAGHPGWTAVNPYQYIAESDYQALQDGSAGFTFVERHRGIAGGSALLEAADDPAVTRLFGLFGGAAGHFESPLPTNDGSRVIHLATRENPTLAEATEAALTVLSRDPDGFMVMIEQGDIDWANHRNDYARMIGTVYDLDRAVSAAIAFVNRPDDHIDWNNTLLIVTSDHGNNYMRIQNTAALRNGQLPLQLDPDGNGTFNDRDAEGKSLSYPHGEVTFGATSHTNELVTYYAKGRGTPLLRQYQGLWYPGTRIIDNTHLYQAMLQAAQLR